MRRPNFRGAFTKLMKEHPDLKDLLYRLRRRRLPKMTVTSIHREFLQALRKKGLGDSDYPFNTYELGRKPLTRFLRKLDDSICLQAKRSGQSTQMEPRIRACNTTLKVMRKVLGSMKRGRRPHVCFQGVIFNGEILSCTPSMIGQPIQLAVDPQDIRIISAFYPDGRFLDNLSSSRLSAFGHPISLEDHRRQMREAQRRRCGAVDG